MKDCITITFGEQVENHVGMEQLGSMASEGLNRRDFDRIVQSLNGKYERIDLGEKIQRPELDAEVLVIREGIDLLLGHQSSELYRELKALPWDTQAKMYGRVVNKRARYNLCFHDCESNADYANGRGTVIAFDSVPLLKRLRNRISMFFGPKADHLYAEGNLYYDVSQCGIGFHGDGERKIVIAARLGEAIPLHYQWYHQNKRVGERIALEIRPGDLYVMNEKATGNDWKKRSILTLRHAAGCEKYLK